MQALSKWAEFLSTLMESPPPSTKNKFDLSVVPASDDYHPCTTLAVSFLLYDAFHSYSHC